jgi:AcrR family transcriptional regulator
VLTHYFRDKDELIGSAFEWLARRAFAALDERLDAVPEGLAQLTAALTFMVPLRGEVSYPGVWLALWTAARRNPALAAVHREYYARWRRRLLQALRCAHRRGEVTAPLSLADQLDLLVSGIDGLWLGIVNDPRRYPPARRERLVRALIEALVRPVAS